jgi:hypothetical protein
MKKMTSKEQHHLKEHLGDADGALWRMTTMTRRRKSENRTALMGAEW